MLENTLQLKKLTFVHATLLLYVFKLIHSYLQFCDESTKLHNTGYHCYFSSKCVHCESRSQSEY